MNISVKAMVSNSEMIKNYKDCRDKADSLGKVFIFKNNRPDAVLVTVAEYERLSVFIEYLGSLEELDIATIIESIPKPKEVARKIYAIDHLKRDK